MVSAATTYLVAKACEIFISDLTTRAFQHTKESKRRRFHVSSYILSSIIKFNFKETSNIQERGYISMKYTSSRII